MSSVRPQIKRTYGSTRARSQNTAYSSDTCPSSPLRDESNPTATKRKRPLTDIHLNDERPEKVTKQQHKKLKTKSGSAKKNTTLTQLHFCIDQSIIRSCPLCDLSYTRGALDDEELHKKHCRRVQKGMEWGREEEKERGKDTGSATVVEEDISFGQGESGRVIAVKTNAGGKLGSKVSEYMNTVNLALSAPDIPSNALNSSKAYLFLLRTPGKVREKIIGCLVAQRIESAMQVATQEEISALESPGSVLTHVEGNLYCKPERLPTPMGIPRLFVSSAYRRRGVAQALLTAAARTFVHGCELDPLKGEIAFSQPTSMGRAVMEKWGKGGVRIYEE